MKMISHILLSLPMLLLSDVEAKNYPDHDTDHGVMFENVSSLLAPFTRGGLDGHGGLAWLDYDNDKDLDLLITGGVGFTSGLFRNNGDGTFSDVTVDAGLAIDGHGPTVAGDIDNDGYPDIFMSKEGSVFYQPQNPARLFHNNGDGTFTDITDTAGINSGTSNLMAAMGDINNDGYLDLFVTAPGHRDFFQPPARQDVERLYINNGDLTFTDITESAGVGAGLGSCVVSFSDYDNDHWIDIFVGNCNDVQAQPTPLHLYRNNHNNTFTDIATEAGLNKDLGYWMSLTLGDYNNDGNIDLFSTNFGPITQLGPVEPHALFRNNGDGTYTDVASTELGLNHFSFGASFGDWDNDGWLDLFFAGAAPAAGFIGNPGHMFFNDGEGNFIENNTAHGLDLRNQYVTGVSKADYDGNGFQDIAVFTSAFEIKDQNTGEIISSDTGAPILIRNKGNDNHWVTIRAEGTISNHMAIGARLELYTGDTRQVREIYAGSSFGVSETPWPTFGMGTRRNGLLKTVWPSGLTEWFFVHGDRVNDIMEGEGYSAELFRE